MRVASRWLVVAVVAAVATGCDGGTDGPGDAGAAGFGPPQLAGLCEDVDIDVDSATPGAPTREAAIQEFVAGEGMLSGTTVEGDRILFEGEVVGSLTVSQKDAGGFYVERGEWCYGE